MSRNENYGKYLRELNMIYFDAIELKNLYKNDKRLKLNLEIEKRNTSYQDLCGDKNKMIEVAYAVLDKDLRLKEEAERFLALNLCIVFFNENSKICFPAKNSFNIEKTPIKNIDDLKNATEQDDLNDFAILADDGLRHFQLKRYMGKLETDAFFNFVKKCLCRYGNDIGDTNLLIVLQGNKDGMQVCNIDFKKLSEKMDKLKLSFEGSVLVKSIL